MELFVSKKVGKFIFANENTEEIHKRTKVKNTDSFDQKIPTLVYNYCQWWHSYKSQIIKNKDYMAGITQNK